MVYRGQKVNVFDNHPNADQLGFVFPKNLTDGRYVAFYKGDTSKIALDATIQNNKLNGTKKEYYLNGNIQYLVDFKNDIIEGRQIFYSPNGSIEYIERRQDGKLNGLLQKYHANGVKKLEVLYKDDKEQGTMLEWNEQGKLIKKTSYKNGTFIKVKEIKSKN